MSGNELEMAFNNSHTTRYKFDETSTEMSPQSDQLFGQVCGHFFVLSAGEIFPV